MCHITPTASPQGHHSTTATILCAHGSRCEQIRVYSHGPFLALSLRAVYVRCVISQPTYMSPATLLPKSRSSEPEPSTPIVQNGHRSMVADDCHSIF